MAKVNSTVLSYDTWAVRVNVGDIIVLFNDKYSGIKGSSFVKAFFLFLYFVVARSDSCTLFFSLSKTPFAQSASAAFMTVLFVTVIPERATQLLRQFIKS